MAAANATSQSGIWVKLFDNFINCTGGALSKFQIVKL